MPHITLEMYPGRTMDQKRRWIEAVTDSTAEILNTRPEDVTIHIRELEPWDVAHGGRLESDVRGIEAPTA